MKNYTVNNPQFSDSISIVETTDPGHADNVNAAPKKIFENTLYLKNRLMKPQLLITVESGANVSVSNGDKNYTKVSDGSVVAFDLDGYGTWTASATKGGESSSTVQIDGTGHLRARGVEQMMQRDLLTQFRI